MASRGVHFAITMEQMEQLLAATDDSGVMEFIEKVEEQWDEMYLAESDKAWDAIHRCLTDGSLLYDNGVYPLNHTICGGRQLHDGEDYTVTLVLTEQVRDVAHALQALSENDFRERYFSLIQPEDYDGTIGDEDLEYTWHWFQNVRNLFGKAATENRAIIFTVDA